MTIGPESVPELVGAATSDEQLIAMLVEPARSEGMQLTGANQRALSPLFWTQVNPYGRFELDMNSHFDLAVAAVRVPFPRTVPDEGWLHGGREETGAL